MLKFTILLITVMFLDIIYVTPTSSSANSLDPKIKVTVKLIDSSPPKIYIAFSSFSSSSLDKIDGHQIEFHNDMTELFVYGRYIRKFDQQLVKFGFKKVSKQDYTPIIEYKRLDAISYRVTGKVTANSSEPPKMRYTFDNLRIESVDSDAKMGTLTMDGWIEHDTAYITTSLGIMYKDLSVKIEGNLIRDPQQCDIDFGFGKMKDIKTQLGDKQ